MADTIQHVTPRPQGRTRVIDVRGSAQKWGAYFSTLLPIINKKVSLDPT